MKKFCATAVFLFLFIPMACLAGGERTVTILYTGDIAGQITPKRG